MKWGRNAQKKRKLTVVYLTCRIIVPILSVYGMYLLCRAGNSTALEIIISALAFLLINIFIVRLKKLIR